MKLRNNNKKNETQIENNNEKNENIITEQSIKQMNYCFTIIIDCFVYSGKCIIKIITFVFQISSVYLMWILLHYFSSQLYVKLCTPSNMYGLLMSPFLVTTPYCQGLRWLIYNGSVMINNMWIVLATWLCANLFIMNNNNLNNNVNVNENNNNNNNMNDMPT